jgi:hypothetical protein
MALKKNLNDKEKLGLTKEEVRLAERYLRKNKTKGQIPASEALKLREMFYLGCSFYEIHHQFPQYPRPQIILTCALQAWAEDRDRLISSLSDRVQAKVVKSVIDQVDFLTSMLCVTNTEHLDVMKKYIEDPQNNPKPDLRIQNIKEYKEVLESLNKLIAGASGDSRTKTKALFDVAKKNHPMEKVESKEPKEISVSELIDAELED